MTLSTDPLAAWQALPEPARVFADALAVLYEPLAFAHWPELYAGLGFAKKGAAAQKAVQSLPDTLRPLLRPKAGRDPGPPVLDAAVSERLMRRLGREPEALRRFADQVLRAVPAASLGAALAGRVDPAVFQQLLATSLIVNHSRRDLRLAVHANDFDTALRIAREMQNGDPDRWFMERPLTQLVRCAYDADWLFQREPRLRWMMIEDWLGMLVGDLEDPREARAMLDRCLSVPQVLPADQHLAQELALWCGEPLSAPMPDVAACRSFIEAGAAAALPLFESAQEAWRQTTGNPQQHLYGLPAFLHVCALLAVHGIGAIRDISKHLGYCSMSAVPAADVILGTALAALADEGAYPPASLPEEPDLTCLFDLLMRRWLGQPPVPGETAMLETIIARASAAGYGWIAAEARAVLARCRGEPAQSVLLDVVPPKPAWQRALNRLIALGDGPAARVRLIWGIDRQGGRLRLELREQKPAARGGWTPGKQMELYRYETRSSQEALLPEDRAALHSLGGIHDLWHDDHVVRLLGALTGHPRVYWIGKPGEWLELVEVPPRLSLRRDKSAEGGWLLELLPAPKKPGAVWQLARVKNTSRVEYTVYTHEQQRLGTVLDNGRLHVPEAGRAELARTLQALDRVLPAGAALDAVLGDDDVQPGDPTPCLLLAPAGDGLRAQLLVEPLAGLAR
ncbi:hypothetical protein, partial [Plasticicumulans sp.]|uniref:hypothetical protein n=1 Tax=Plasticicumulans sp. TaxID=2307179 RepID=UPI002BE5ADD2